MFSGATSSPARNGNGGVVEEALRPCQSGYESRYGSGREARSGAPNVSALLSAEDEPTLFDHVIINDDLETAYQEFLKILQKVRF